LPTSQVKTLAKCSTSWSFAAFRAFLACHARWQGRSAGWMAVGGGCGWRKGGGLWSSVNAGAAGPRGGWVIYMPGTRSSLLGH